MGITARVPGIRGHRVLRALTGPVVTVVALAAAVAAGCGAQPAGVGGPAPEGSPPTEAPSLSAGDHAFTLVHDGRARRYVVHVPTAVADSPALVMALHGGGGTADQFKSENGMDEVADRNGFVAVYPDGTGAFDGRLYTWNSGHNCCGYALDQKVDDVGFLLAVLNDLARRQRYDDHRIYVTGHSNGAMMAYRLAAEAADRVAAVVPVGGAMALSDPAPTRPVPLLHIHSVDDPRALYEGGEGPPFPLTNRSVPHERVMDGLDFWADRNGCRPEPVPVEQRTGQLGNRGQTLTRLRWSGCTDGATVEHLRFTGVGHGWPGVEVGRMWQRLLGPSTTMVNASEEVWAFASRFRR